MSIKHGLFVASLCVAGCLASLQAVAGDDWHFVVKNNTSVNITKLQVSQDKSTWGNFDIGSGIGPGERATLIWAASTDEQKCHQWIRAKFSDDSYSEPTKQDFCHDLDDPIEFTE
jgi:hypothetical protein